MKIGIFGGTFNPIHYGHLRAAEEAAEGLLLNKVVFVPTNITSDKKETVLEPEKRLKMINIAIKNHERFESSDIEMRRGGLSYSYDTVIQLKEIYPRDELYFIVGLDTYSGMKNWKNGEKIFDIINFIIVSRACKEPDLKNLTKLKNFLPDELKNGIISDCTENRLITSKNKFIYFLKITGLDISSTNIRNNFKNNVSNLFLLPNEVINYIINNKSYF